jgi:Tol biopolymer transport system component
MTRKIKLFAVAVLLAAAGCDSDPAAEIDRSIKTVQLLAATQQVEAGQTIQLTAIARQADGTIRTDVTFNWSVSDTTVAKLVVNGATATLQARQAGLVVVNAAAETRSASLQLEVTQTAPPNPVPMLDRLEPMALTAGGSGAVVRVKGFAFTPQSVVRWNGVARTTTYVTATELSIVVTPLDIASAGDADLRVFTPGPGGGLSPMSLTFTIYGPAADLTINAPAELMQWTGESVQLTATVKDALGRVLQGVPVAWYSETAALVQVDATGKATTLRAGAGRVSARVDQLVRSIQFQTMDAPNADVIFDALDDDVRQLFVVSPGVNLNRRKLIPGIVPGTDAAVSPDGQRIAFVGIGLNRSTEIFVVNRDGSGLRQLTTSGYEDDQPTWSPDGQRIAFRSTRSFGYSDVWVMNADGSDQTNLTFSEVRVGLSANLTPTWSPDGKTIIYTLTDYGMSPLRGTTMAKNLVAGTTRILQNDPRASDFDPAYSPDGVMVALRRKLPNVDEQIMIISPATGEYWLFIDYPGPGSKPAWSPNGKWLAFESSPTGTGSRGVYLNLLGTYHRRGIGVGSFAGNPANPAWIAR